jgi:biotin carboxyl carrier protein
MRLIIEIDGREREAEITVVDSVARIVIDGRAREAELSAPEPGLYVLTIANRVYRCAIEPGTITVNGRRMSVAVRDPKRRGAGGKAAGQGGGRTTLVAPMPGKVVRVLCAAGDEVAAGQGVLVVEAMKMQNEVLSPRAGKVAEIRVADGQTVNAGEVLAVVE